MQTILEASLWVNLLGYSLKHPCHWQQRQAWWCLCEGTKNESALPLHRPRARWLHRSSYCQTDLVRRQRVWEHFKDTRRSLPFSCWEAYLHTTEEEKDSQRLCAYPKLQRNLKDFILFLPRGFFSFGTKLSLRCIFKFFGSSGVFDMWRQISQALMQ